MTLLGALVVLLHLHRRNLDFLHTYIHTYIHTLHRENLWSLEVSKNGANHIR